MSLCDLFHKYALDTPNRSADSLQGPGGNGRINAAVWNQAGRGMVVGSVVLATI